MFCCYCSAVSNPANCCIKLRKSAILCFLQSGNTYIGGNRKHVGAAKKSSSFVQSWRHADLVNALLVDKRPSWHWRVVKRHVTHLRAIFANSAVEDWARSVGTAGSAKEAPQRGIGEVRVLRFSVEGLESGELAIVELLPKEPLGVVLHCVANVSGGDLGAPGHRGRDRVVHVLRGKVVDHTRCIVEQRAHKGLHLGRVIIRGVVDKGLLRNVQRLEQIARNREARDRIGLVLAWQQSDLAP
jgi:hypothetical protein